MLKELSSLRKSLLIIVILLIMTITFETFQQLYYIERYSIAEGVTFFDILQTQSYRWIIWMLIGLILVNYSKRNSVKKEYVFTDFIKYAIFIAALVVINIIVISLLQMWMSGDIITFNHFVGEYFPFYIYQKAPIYTMGYIAIAIILHFYFAYSQLQIEVEQLSALKKTNALLYEKLKSNIDDRTKILNIKIGNKRKIIPVSNIRWIESDDYCVKVHTLEDESYTMRSSLKALESKLDDNFLRVHRKAIVNMDLATELRLSKNPCLLIANDLEIPIAKSQLKSVRDFLS